ncbi:MAG TPA: helix-turn-helix domain-containing protein [Gemmatimonadaceae bacterium]|nr:helix-turn-helix domain-containing protein [Gemmatimonadaceae bacterium]
MERRSYNEYCGLAKALDFVGERWTLLVVRDLLLGPLRYSELLSGLPGITTNLLAKRLQEMEAHGLVERIGEGARRAYRLTTLGAELEPAVHALGRWGWHRMRQPPARGEHRSLEWLLVALRRRRRAGATPALRAELVADGVPYHIVVSPDGARIGRGAPDGGAPDIRLRGPASSIAQLFLSGLEQASPPPGLEVEGRPELLAPLVEAFARGEE